MLRTEITLEPAFAATGDDRARMSEYLLPLKFLCFSGDALD
jgi:hypothetical protein